MKSLITLMLVGLFSLEAQAASVFVAAENGASLSIIDTKTSETKQVQLPISPHNVDLTPDGKWALASGSATRDAAKHGAPGAAGGQLVIVDLMTSIPTIAATVAVGGHPAHVVPSHDGRNAYVTDGETNSVVIVDLVERKVVGRIPVGASPHGLRLSPDGRALAVANMKNDSISLIDINAGNQAQNIAVGSMPAQVAFDPAGKFLVVTLSGEDAVAIIELSTRAVTRKVAVGRGPIQVAVTPDGTRALVANQGTSAKPDDRLSIISLRDGKIEKTVVVGRGAHGVAVSPDGKTAFVTNTYADTVSAVDLSSYTVTGTFPTGKGPNGIVARKE